jgi:ferredoxin-thioredoxin reductase catalytic subunit
MGYVDQDVNEENENEIEYEMCPCYPVEHDLLSIVIRSLRAVGLFGCMTHLSTIHGLELPSSVKSSLASSKQHFGITQSPCHRTSLSLSSS